MKLVALLDPVASIPDQVASVLRIADAVDDDVLILVRPTATNDADAGQAARRIASQVCSLVTRQRGFRAETCEDELPPTDPSDAVHNVTVARLDDHDAVVRRVNEADTDLLLVLLGDANPKDGRARAIGLEVLPRVTCRVAVLRLGPSTPTTPLRILVPTSPSPHVATALRLAHELATPDDGTVTALYVEPRSGNDAASIGRRALDRVLNQALGKDRFDVERLVVLADSLDAGLAQVCAEGNHDLIVIGTWLGELGSRFQGTIGGRVTRKRTELPVLAVRRAIPFTNRLRRRVELLLQDNIPQLSRDHRLDLFERVQSNSTWNFDFVALISLSTFIAALGLLQDSAAVVIGAMLVAPLMTPILGVGLALVQGNHVLVRGALRTVLFGALTAFAIAALVGLTDPGYRDPTQEMAARGGPGVRDLLVAFLSGLAAAYATSRSSLAAALPGVAIAAALVPPIATAGLATSSGDLSLAYGALLLFFTNMVAIVVASSLCLSAVGVRSVKGGSRRTRAIGYSMAALTLLLGLHLATRSTRPADPIPAGCRTALRKALPGDQRLADLRLTDDHDAPILEIHLGSTDTPATGLVMTLQQVAERFIPGLHGVRLIHRWEAQSPPR